MNPTTDVLEQRLTALEGGAAAVAVSSGQTASAYAIQNLVTAGDNIVSSTDLYGGTWNLFKNTLAQQGVEVRFVDPANPQKPVILEPVPIMPKPCRTRSWRCFQSARSWISAVNVAFR
jgi:O-acetylhomoserine/O-acetylserine sulfhydrylase-like pyridoxal-dependent enzyme